MTTNEPELRQDIVSNDWVLLAKTRAKRPHADLFIDSPKNFTQKRACPFEDPKKSGNKTLFVSPDETNWFVRVITNKYPAVIVHETDTCPVPYAVGAYRKARAIGFHEVVVTRDHEQSLGMMSVAEGVAVVRAWLARMRWLNKQPCVDYTILFHNHGRPAGASISHPHSQIITLPVVPPDVADSLRGARQFFEEHGVCVHCHIIAEELHEQKRIIYQNDHFIVFAPFASRVNFEMRVMPRAHEPRFQNLATAHEEPLADALTAALRALYKKTDDPPYNFFIHTTPPRDKSDAYHWHLEILPKTTTWAGLELGTGLEAIVVSPEDAARLLRK